MGIQPLRMEEGYLILTMGQSKGAPSAPTGSTNRESSGVEAYLQLQLECVEERTASRYEPAESIKWSLIGRTGMPSRDLPRPCRLGGSPAAHAAADCPSPAPSGAHAGVTIT